MHRDCPLDCKVYVGNLGNNGNKTELERSFGYYGPLRSVWVARNPPGFAFVEFEDPRDATDAVRELDGRTLCGCRVRVELSNGEKRSRNRGPPPSWSRRQRDDYRRRSPPAAGKLLPLIRAANVRELVETQKNSRRVGGASAAAGAGRSLETGEETGLCPQTGTTNPLAPFPGQEVVPGLMTENEKNVKSHDSLSASGGSESRKFLAVHSNTVIIHRQQSLKLHRVGKTTAEGAGINKTQSTVACFSAANMTTDRELSEEGQCTTVFTSHGVDITPRKDQGVLKIVKQPGAETERPMIGDKLFVHYTGKLLNGKKFDSSLDRKEPFTFSLGKGQVIKAWDIGLATMQKGEVCLFLCKPEYAYGATGSPPKVPPNSTLLFEVELLDFKGELLTEDGGILRRIKVKGDGFSNPNEGARVHVHLQGSSGGRVFDSRDLHFVVGEAEDHNIPLGVDRAMDKMQKGECCVLHLKPKYGFGREGKPEFSIGPNAELSYEVTLKDFER
ncbi:hypothetical protein GJAV_G00184780 [Gymnothorax javanicus]|nr:hypothetical protein GJAV_G00184780 [Gymnothorax javanicus]